MIIQSNTKPIYFFPNMSFRIMTSNQTFTEISKNYKCYVQLFHTLKFTTKLVMLTGDLKTR